MNKHILVIITLLIAFVSSSFAQTKIEKYCVVITTPKNGWTSKRVSYLSIGEMPDVFSFKDSTVIINLQKVNSLTTDADVLNYLASLGWSCISIIALPNLGEKLYFKRGFDKSELAGN